MKFKLRGLKGTGDKIVKNNFTGGFRPQAQEFSTMNAGQEKAYSGN
ncbi:MAG TPA: hypothetical protein VFE71_10415 [Bacteroidales bacterium]|jgi:hypothetical protein|nr:hypothetical protein [Bacteroidales bacterium]